MQPHIYAFLPARYRSVHTFSTELVHRARTVGSSTNRQSMVCGSVLIHRHVVIHCTPATDKRNELPREVQLEDGLPPWRLCSPTPEQSLLPLRVPKRLERIHRQLVREGQVSQFSEALGKNLFVYEDDDSGGEASPKGGGVTCAPASPRSHKRKRASAIADDEVDHRGAKKAKSHQGPFDYHLLQEAAQGLGVPLPPSLTLHHTTSRAVWG